VGKGKERGGGKVTEAERRFEQSRVDFGWGKGQLENRRGCRVCRARGKQSW
jgi:hypothetical protein